MLRPEEIQVRVPGGGTRNEAEPETVDAARRPLDPQPRDLAPKAVIVQSDIVELTLDFHCGAGPDPQIGLDQQMVNILSRDKQITVIAALSEGMSIRSVERLTGIHRDTIMRLGCPRRAWLCRPDGRHDARAVIPVDRSR